MKRRILHNSLIVACAALCAGARFVPGSERSGPVVTAAAALVRGTSADSDSTRSARSIAELGARTRAALAALASAVRPLSDPDALTDAFKSYFAFKAAHPEEVRKPYLYFVDYGLPSTSKRGYVFDMDALEIVDGPFTVAHGRGSAATRDGVPKRFSNAPGSYATSLGLFVAQETYGFFGRTVSGMYRSIGLRLDGVSGPFNDTARERGVVAHGAPYVTPNGAGRSEGCPAMEPARAKRLLPKLANGGMVFLFAPDSEWRAEDPWISAGEE